MTRHREPTEVGPETGSAPAIEFVDVHQGYGSGENRVHALRGVDLRIERGEYVAIMGPSGSGKSTLMNILGCLDVPERGVYRLAGQDVGARTEDELARIRGRALGFVFQSFNLIPRMTALANVALPMAYAGVGRPEQRERATAALRRVGLEARADHLPAELSGGQQQRVAVARALVMEPTLVLADEPTGNLDSASTEDVLSVFDSLAAEHRTIVVITHEQDVAERAGRVLVVADGLVVDDRPSRGARR
ncbi:ABC transporter ATP-binding protein [Curtobacterium sp. 22159]|uniref:ABC transporter ATP-binding protein n=1 Tax=Curtobacterium sp. 22159 TaxID=3453882 RepID=UPI003F84B369